MRVKIKAVVEIVIDNNNCDKGCRFLWIDIDKADCMLFPKDEHSMSTRLTTIELGNLTVFERCKKCLNSSIYPV